MGHRRVYNLCCSSGLVPYVYVSGTCMKKRKRTTSDFKTSRSVIHLGITALVTLMTVSATAGSSLEEIAQEEMSRLNEASGLHSVLNFKLTDYIAAEPNGTIYFPESVVEDIQTKANTTQTKQVIRFLLAHEQAHQVQFRTYGVNAVRPGAYGVNAVKPSDGPSDRARQ